MIQYKTTGTVVKTFNFNYINSPTQRLTLGSVTEWGKNPYVFSYDNRESLSDYLQNTSNASQSSGIMGGQIQYFFSGYTVPAYNANSTKVLSAFSSISVLPACHNSQGSAIGYTEVIEKRPDNSFTRYQFTNFDNGYMDEPTILTSQINCLHPHG